MSTSTSSERESLSASATLAVAFGLCFWQNHLLLEIANRSLPNTREPITFSVSEPFMTTVTIAATRHPDLLPVILYQAYAFILPALTDRERKVILPFLFMVPVLFIAGVVFAYFVVFPAAVNFLLNFNTDEFNIQVRARDYYGFSRSPWARSGCSSRSRSGCWRSPASGSSPRAARRNRRYAILVIAVVAMLLPGTDPVTMLISMVPLILLFEGVIFARIFGRRPEPRLGELNVTEPRRAGH